MTYYPPGTGAPDPMVLSCMTDDAASLVNYVGQAGSSAVYPTANLALFFPVRLANTHTYQKAWWLNGATVAGNVDVGIYTLSGTTLSRVVASTAEAQAGASVMQVATTFTATTVGPGLYYLALSCTSTTATFFRASTGVAPVAKAHGYFQAATSSPLPSSATAVAILSTYLPAFGFSESTVI